MFLQSSKHSKIFGSVQFGNAIHEPRSPANNIKHNVICCKNLRQQVDSLNISQRLLADVICLTSYSLRQISRASGIQLSTLFSLRANNTHKLQEATFQKLFYYFCKIYSDNNNSKERSK